MMGDRYTVPMAVKTMKVLEAFCTDGPKLALSEVVALTKLPKVSVYRILETLRSLGYLFRSEHGLYRLTFRLMDLGVLFSSEIH